MYVLPNDLILKKLGNFKKISEMFRFDGEYAAAHPKAKFWQFSVKIAKNLLYLKLFRLVSWICLHPKGCLRKQVSVSNSVHTSWFYIFWRFQYLKRSIQSSNWHLRNSVAKNTWIWCLSKNTILHFSIKYELGTKHRSNCSRAVFMKSFYFSLVKADHFLGIQCIFRQVQTKKKFSENLGQNIGRPFSLFSTVSFHHYWRGTRLSLEIESTSCLTSCRRT